MTELQLRILEGISEYGPATGGQLVKVVPGLLKGTVHTTLVRLEAAGLVMGRQEERGTVAGHPRVFYTLTKLGQLELRLQQAAEAERAAFAKAKKS
jgi:DNA-binding PadR family transcriptional regulator